MYLRFGPTKFNLLFINYQTTETLIYAKLKEPYSTVEGFEQNAFFLETSPTVYKFYSSTGSKNKNCFNSN